MLAETLIKQHYYSASVNRAYYSCLQFMLHILIEKLGHTYGDINKIQRTGTHAKAQHLLGMTLARKDNIGHKWIENRMRDFKDYRVTADYRGDPLNQDIGYEVIRTATAIINILKKNY